MNRDHVDSVLRSLRRVNIQSSFLGQTVAIRFGLSESDIETLEQLIDLGATSAGKLSELTGLTSGAVTRVIDRLEQAGYVRRVPDPTDRRRVIVEVVPEKVANIQVTLDQVSSASAQEIRDYSDEQLALIADFLTRMESVTREEAEAIRESSGTGQGGGRSTSEHFAPLGGLSEAKLAIRSGLSSLRLRPGDDPADLYRATFEGATPQVRLRDGRVLVQFKGFGFDWRGRVAAFALNTTIPWTIEVVGGIQKVEADLRLVPVRSLDIVGGAERVQLELGQPAGETAIRIVGGVNTVRAERPKGVPMRLQVAGGADSIVLDGTRLDKRGGPTSMESPGWAEDRDRIDLSIVGGAKSIEIVSRG
ncbi:MAG TPA: MarR family transcriptional regulator [Candidatus Limnocylindrales bacterium]